MQWLSIISMYFYYHNEALLAIFGRLVTVYGRLVALKAGPHFQLLLKYQHRDVTKNVPLGPALAAAWDSSAKSAVRSDDRNGNTSRSQRDNSVANSEVMPVLQSLIGPSTFRRARLFTTTKDVDLKLKASGSGKLAILKPSLKSTLQHALPSGADGSKGEHEGATATGAAKASVVQLQSHDRAKVVPVPPASLFLQRLGVTKADGRNYFLIAGRTYLAFCILCNSRHMYSTKEVIERSYLGFH